MKQSYEKQRKNGKISELRISISQSNVKFSGEAFEDMN